MRLCFITVRRVPDTPSPLLLDVSRLLERAGHDVRHERAEDMVFTVTSRVATGPWCDCLASGPADLYLLKSHTELALSIAGALHDRGARLLNPYPACAAAQDKVRATAALHRAGVPVPATQVVAGHAAAAALFRGTPLVVKPVRGHRGAGVSIVSTEGDLDGWQALADTDGGLLVQDLVDGPGEDLKVYVVGRDVWAVRKPFGPDSFTRPGRPVAVDPEVGRIVERVSRTTGLSIYGLDIIEGPNGPVVVDLNYFPGYKGCVGVAEPMARHIHEFAVRRDDAAGESAPAHVADLLAGVP
ncbi:MAG: hypothetical protein HOQ27_13075 [Dermatophilaceae bacterium]|nr:hypothetical protein [Dermatophilaceae bacterium]